MTSNDANELLRLMRMDLSQLQARLTDLTNIINALHLEDRPRPACPHCGLTFKSTHVKDEHVYVTHAGPEPPHWLHAETLIEQPTTIEGR